MSNIEPKSLTPARRLALKRLNDGWNFTLGCVWVNPEGSVLNGLWGTTLRRIDRKVANWLIETKCVTPTTTGYHITNRGCAVLAHNTKQVNHD